MEKKKKADLRPTDYEQYVFGFIINRLDYFDNYYGHFSMFVPSLQYQEYSTLTDDLKQYFKAVIFEVENVDVKQIHSFKRSLELIRNKIKHINTPACNMFVAFCDFSILNLDEMVNRLIEEILSKIE
jgi:hypothetical protein